MKRVVALLFLALNFAAAQNDAQMMHAPDGGTMERLVSIYISPILHAPFSATLTTEWAQRLEDGTTVTRQNHRTIMRDSAGRIFQERRMFLPKDSAQEPAVIRIEITDPVAHLRYFCNPETKMCGEFPYTAPVVQASAPLPIVKGGDANLQRIDLGKSEIVGVEATGTREILTIKEGKIGNDRPIESTKEIWYSSKLDLNVSVKRVDPRHGTETFLVKELSLGEPSPESFKVPAGYTVRHHNQMAEDSENSGTK